MHVWFGGQRLNNPSLLTVQAIRVTSIASLETLLNLRPLHFVIQNRKFTELEGFGQTRNQRVCKRTNNKYDHIFAEVYLQQQLKSQILKKDEQSIREYPWYTDGSKTRSVNKQAKCLNEMNRYNFHRQLGSNQGINKSKSAVGMPCYLET